MMIKDYKIGNDWVKHICTPKGPNDTRSGSIWKNMRNRCTKGSAAQEHSPSYIGCTMSENFKDFQFFAEWCQSQVGYGIKDYEIDKDILVPGNKMYSEDRCVFVPKHLNIFLLSHLKGRGLYPQGVSFQQSVGRFRADVRINGINNYLGLFNTPEEAFIAYKIAKEIEAKRWGKRLESGEFLIDQRVIISLKNYSVPL